MKIVMGAGGEGASIIQHTVTLSFIESSCPVVPITSHIYFCIFFNIFNNPCVSFLRIWMTSADSWEILRKCSEIFKTSLKNCQNALFYHFSKDLTNNALIYFEYGRKSQIIWKIWENLRKLLKIFASNAIF